MIWPFRRKPAPPAISDHRNLNEDWAPGDLAVCVNDEWLPTVDAFDPRKGDVLRVSSVEDAVDQKRGYRAYWLRFVGKSNPYECVGFRKIRPAEDEFTMLVRKRKKAPETVG
jgi:hypothetical protein